MKKKKKKTKKLAIALQHGNHSCKVSQIAPVNQKKIVKTEFRFMFSSLFSLHRQEKKKEVNTSRASGNDYQRAEMGVATLS